MLYVMKLWRWLLYMLNVSMVKEQDKSSRRMVTESY